MSRFNLYLIYFLIYIEFVYLYDLNGHRDNVEERIGPNMRQKKSRFKNKNRMAQFDVASFIQKPDTGNSYGFENVAEKRRRTSKDYDYGPLNDITGEVRKGQEKYSDLTNFDRDNAPEFNYNAPMPRDIINDRQSKLTGFDGHIMKYKQNEMHRPELMDGAGHNLEKKCSFKNMKFPFFSRKSQNAKSDQKRKLFCFNCPKKSTSLEITTSNIAEKNAAALQEKTNLKRSNNDVYKSYTPPEESQSTVKDIHNSRQFYQNLANYLNTNNENESDSKNNEGYNRNEAFETSASEDDLLEYFNEAPLNREKREELDDNVRRLKILDEIQRKVDSLEIKVPNYPKLS